MKLINGARVRVKVKKWFKEVDEEGIVIANILEPFRIMDHETDLPIKSSWFLVWTFYNQKIRSYHMTDIDAETTELQFKG